MFKPRTVVERRTWALILTLLDTGVRIEEALTLERDRVDLDRLVLVVMGKGSKERPIPFSHELRRILFRHLQQSVARYDLSIVE
jgi:site-specific recombinase XerD